MADSFYDSAEWKLGDSAQQRWSRIVANRGGVVLPTYGMDGVDQSTKAPVLFSEGGLIIAPDLLVLNRDKGHTWHDVKAKSQPSWRRFTPGPRWEHGFDYSLFEEYSAVARETGVPMWVIVHEVRSPVDPAEDSPLVESDVWLGIELERLNPDSGVSQHRPDWPGGRVDPCRRGRRRRGGLLWARSAMTVLSSSVVAAPVAEVEEDDWLSPVPVIGAK